MYAAILRRLLKGVGTIEELVTAITRGMPLNAVATGADLERAPRTTD